MAAAVAKQYGEGEKAVRARRDGWEKLATTVLLPTLEEAATILKRHGLKSASAKRRTFGDHLESVQLETGPVMTDVLLDIPAHPDRLVFELSAGLGYSLAVDGRVYRWHRDHCLTGFGPRSQMVMQEDYTDFSLLTPERIREHVLKFLRNALDGSYRHPDTSKRRIGFFEKAES